MSNSEGDIVIPRSKLPHVVAWYEGMYVEGVTLQRVSAAACNAYSMRRDAYERLAIADAIDHLLAVHAEEKLLSEAVELASKVDGVNYTTHRFSKAYWTKVARAAREVYGVK